MLHGLWMAAWHGLWMFLYQKLGWEAVNAAVVILTSALILSFKLTCESVSLFACMFVLGWSLTQSLVHLQPTRSSSESICSRPGSSIPGSPGHTIYVSHPRQRLPSLTDQITIHSQMESVAAWGCTGCSFPFSYFSLNSYICTKLLITTRLLIENIHAYTQNRYDTV